MTSQIREDDGTVKQLLVCLQTLSLGGDNSYRNIADKPEVAEAIVTILMLWPQEKVKEVLNRAGYRTIPGAILSPVDSTILNEDSQDGLSRDLGSLAGNSYCSATGHDDMQGLTHGEIGEPASNIESNNLQNLRHNLHDSNSVPEESVQHSSLSVSRNRKRQVGCGDQNTLLVPVQKRARLIDTIDVWSFLYQRFREGSFGALAKQTVSIIPNVHPDLSRLGTKDPHLATKLMETFVKPGNIVKMLKLLAIVSEDKGKAYGAPAITDIVIHTVGSGFGPVGVGAAGAQYSSILKTARQAHSYLVACDMPQELGRLRIILSYITLFWTLKYVIEPKIRAENLQLNKKQLEGARNQAFMLELLGENPGSISMNQFKEYLRYGKFYSEVVDTLGMTAIVMLAVLDTGITTLAKHFGPQSYNLPYLAIILLQNVQWMSLCATVGPVIVECLFTDSKSVYGLPTLQVQLFSHPMSVQNAEELHEAFLKLNHHRLLSVPDTEMLASKVMAIEEAEMVCKPMGISFSVFPNNELLLKLDNYTKNIPLLKWLLEHDAEDEFVIVSPATTLASNLRILAREVASLLHPGPIHPALISFFAEAWNQQALPGWHIIPPSYTKKLLNQEYGPDLTPALRLVSGRCRFGIPYDNFLVPLCSSTGIFLLEISVPLRTIEVLCPLDCMETRAETDQGFKILAQNVIFDEWVCSGKVMGLMGGSKMVPSVHNRMLLALHYMHNKATGTQFYGEHLASQDTPNSEEIIVGCLFELYNLELGEMEAVFPSVQSVRLLPRTGRTPVSGTLPWTDARPVVRPNLRPGRTAGPYRCLTCMIYFGYITPSRYM
ncbi:hypothetical protein L873DRAFT_1788344 [Choiromyces venosus 120613-1]|uniref:Uncharacterized protein n=1 Tax=Choiromyces venosus 120613-1 TaxID=1336337 RepID=A0A3N4K6B5_9PEZI|nr:hypothetical protein L873DRAFT_1788344 [Choiromyces venosus 120613-1]